MKVSRFTILFTGILIIASFGLNAQNWSENFENYPIRDSSYKFGYTWSAATIGTGGLAISGRSMTTSPLNNPFSPSAWTTGYFAMTGATYNIALQTRLTNITSSPVLTVHLVDMAGTEVATIFTYAYPGSGLAGINFNFTGLNGWYRIRFKFSGSGGGSRAIIDNISSSIPSISLTGSSTRLSDIQTTVQITGTDCNSQTVTVRFTNLGPDPAFAYGNMGMATLQSLTGINYSAYSTSPNLRLDPLTNTLYFFESFSTTGLQVNQFLELTINLNTPNNCNVSLGSTFQWFSLQTDQSASNNTDYQNASFTILPASLSAFQTQVSNDRVKISWTASNEVNISHYIIERSGDGNSFKPIGSVRATGIGQSSVRYEFEDAWQQGSAFYRIILVDYDNNSTYGRIVAVHANTKQYGFSIFPNPLKKPGSLSVLSPLSGNITLELIETGGKILTRMKIRAERQNTIKIALPQNIKAGLYHVRLFSDKEFIGTRSLLIQD